MSANAIRRTRKLLAAIVLCIALICAAIGLLGLFVWHNSQYAEGGIAAAIVLAVIADILKP
jgi:hypothetical protein